MELKTYVCPNCGANTTNAQNCEYCGSLLVRFVEKGIDLSHTSYLNNNAVFPGLVEELKRNLKLQSENLNVVVVTDMLKETATGNKSCISIISSLLWADDTKSPEFDRSEGKKQLCISIGFDTYTDVANHKEFNDEMDAQLARFRQLDSFPLFTAHNCTYEDEYGSSCYGREYAINFGEDAEGAARLVSEILIKVKGWLPTEPYDMFTNVGEDYLRAREEWDAAHGFGADSDSQQTSGFEIDSNLLQIIGWAVAIIIIVLSFVGC